MAQTGSLQNLFADLNRLGKNQDYERAVRVANKILQEAPEEQKAFHCKVVCLIQLGRFDEALTAIHKNPALSAELAFERGYCEYRLNRTQESLKTLRAVEEPDDRIKELLAQVLYRLEEFQESYDVYRDLVKNTQDDFEEERETNLSATMAALQLWSGEELEDYGMREDTYELCYNSACCLIGRGDLKEAEFKLRLAQEICMQTFEDDPDTAQEDIDAELGVIRVQLAYVLQLQGRNDEAMKLYNQVVKQRLSDLALTAVASNNIVTLNKDQNVFDSKKKIKAATGANLNQKLTASQKESIALNQCLLYMYTNQGDQCGKMADKLKDMYADNPTPSLIQAAQLVRDKQMNQAITALQEDIKKYPSHVSLRFTLAQLLLTHGSVYQACTVLRSLGNLTYKPGVVSALVTLYLSQEDKDSAAEVLKEAVEWNRKNQPGSDELSLVVKASANFHLQHGDPQTAANLLEERYKSDPKDTKNLAQLIAAYSKFDPKKAQTISRQLPSPEDMAKDIDVDALESAISTLGPKYIKKATKGEQSPKPGASGDELELKKKKKKRKTILPKNYDPKVDPDPERWIPRRERSYYRGKRKDKRKDIGKGTQGSSSAAQDAFDISKSGTASASGSEVGSPRPGATPQASASGSSVGQASGPRQQNPKPSKAKKKKVPTATLR